MMATTEIGKVPPTIQSRSQVFELKAISVKQIADQLRAIAAAEQIAVDEAAIMLIARAGDGSMRDAQSAFDQVIGFAGTTITAEDVATVLGLVRRELLISIADAVAREDAPALFEMAGRAVESGYDLRLVVRELARMTRDLLVLTIDPSRISDPENAADGERQLLLDLSRRFSGEDLMRAFDVLTKAEYEIRSAMQPRYHLEMALLRWLHLRKLVPLTDLIGQIKAGAPVGLPVGPAFRPGTPQAVSQSRPDLKAGPTGPPRAATVQAVEAKLSAPPAPAPKPAATESAEPNLKPVDPSQLKDAFLGEIRKAKKFFYGTVVAQAQRIDLEADKVVFVFGPQHRALRVQLEQNRPWLEAAASQLAGRKMSVTAAEGTSAPPVPPKPSGFGHGEGGKLPENSRGSQGGTKPSAVAPEEKQSLKERALSDAGVQTMLDVFAAEIKDVEEM